MLVSLKFALPRHAGAAGKRALLLQSVFDAECWLLFYLLKYVLMALTLTLQGRRRGIWRRVNDPLLSYELMCLPAPWFLPTIHILQSKYLT